MYRCMGLRRFHDHGLCFPSDRFTLCMYPTLPYGPSCVAIVANSFPRNVAEVLRGADDACSADEDDDVVVCIAKASAMLFGPSSLTLEAFAT